MILSKTFLDNILSKIDVAAEGNSQFYERSTTGGIN